MRISTILLAFICAMPIAAQDTTAIITNSTQTTSTVGSRLRDENFFALGLQAGLATGSGIAFRYTTPSRFAGEITIGYIAIEKTAWSIGGELQYLLSNSSKYRFYALGGLSANYVGENGENTLNAPVRIGLGVGYEWFFNEHISLGAEVPITIFLDNPAIVLPIPQLQLMFYFQ
jgi:hypothetical protein